MEMNPWWCNRDEEPIILIKTTDPYGSLLNMARGYSINYEDVYWKSAEALYQAHRFLDVKLRDYVNAQQNAYLAKQCMKQLRDEGLSVSEELWELVKVPIMEQCLNLKFEQHPALGEMLMSTFPKPLVELSTKGDKFWGCIRQNGKLVGKNTLGKLLMKIRYEYLNGAQTKLNV
jgi:ribA/ribD-fused uncharacterized protein